MLGHLRGPPAVRGSFGRPVPGTRRQPTVFGWLQSTRNRLPPCQRQSPGTTSWGCGSRRQLAGWSSSVRPRVLLGSTGMLGPMVVVMATFLRYRPLAADGFSRRISSMAAA